MQHTVGIVNVAHILPEGQSGPDEAKEQDQFTIFQKRDDLNHWLNENLDNKVEKLNLKFDKKIISNNKVILRCFYLCDV